MEPRNIEQKSEALRLFFVEDTVDPNEFSVYTSKEFSFHSGSGIKVSVYVIGESHVVVCNGLFGIHFSEVLACVSLDRSWGSWFSAGLLRRTLKHPKHPLCVGHYDELRFTKQVLRGRYYYTFEMRRMDFSNPSYEREFLKVFDEGGMIGYNFTTGSEMVSKEDMHEPVTLLSLFSFGDIPQGLRWSSVHVYPNEELGIFSTTTLLRKEAA